MPRKLKAVKTPRPSVVRTVSLLAIVAGGASLGIGSGCSGESQSGVISTKSPACPPTVPTEGACPDTRQAFNAVCREGCTLFRTGCPYPNEKVGCSDDVVQCEQGKVVILGSACVPLVKDAGADAQNDAAADASPDASPDAL